MPVDDEGHRAQRRLEALIGQIRRAGVTSREALSQMCRHAGMDDEQAAAIEAQPLNRVELYDELIVGRVVRALQAMMPVSAERFELRFLQAARGFARVHTQRSIHLRDLAKPFARWVQGQWQTPQSPGASGAELVYYEATRIEVASAADGWVVPGGACSGGGQFSLPVASALMQTRYPVHYWVEGSGSSLSRIGEPGTVDGQYCLLLYRRQDSEVFCLQLSAYAFALLHALGKRQLPFAQAMGEACAQCNTAPTESLLAQVATLLDELLHARALCWNDSPVHENCTELNQPAIR